MYIVRLSGLPASTQTGEGEKQRRLLSDYGSYTVRTACSAYSSAFYTRDGVMSTLGCRSLFHPLKLDRKQQQQSANHSTDPEQKNLEGKKNTLFEITGCRTVGRKGRDGGFKLFLDRQ